MPYDTALANRIRSSFGSRSGVVERKMFGGVGFLLHGNMCVCVWKDSLIARVGPEQYDAALREPFVREFDITGRPMTGWIMVSPAGVEDDDQLREWIDRAIQFVRLLPHKESRSGNQKPRRRRRVRPRDSS